MKTQLSSQHIELYSYMKSLSQKAVSKPWIRDFEFELWDAYMGRSQSYGKLKFDQPVKNKLAEWVKITQGWIMVNRDHEPTFVPIEEFRQIRNEKITKGLNWMNEASDGLNSSEWFGAIIIYFLNIGKVQFEEIYTRKNLKRNAIVGWLFKIVLIFGFFGLLFSYL